MLQEAEAALLEIRGGGGGGGDDLESDRPGGSGSGSGSIGGDGDSLGVVESGSCGVKAAVAARRQLQLLRGLHAAVADNAHWTATLLSRFGAHVQTARPPPFAWPAVLALRFILHSLWSGP